MAGEDQERFEDYLELEQFIAELQAGKTARPPQKLTPAQERAYRMALLFHAATPGMSEPDSTFAKQLRARLEEEIQLQRDERRLLHMPSPRALRKQRVPRRSLLTGGAIAAASVAIGTGVGYLSERAINGEVHVTGSSVATEWFVVMNVADLGDQAVKFVSEQVVGYVVRSDSVDKSTTPAQIIAMSAVCTHRGCIVQWFNSDRKYHCPCHGGVFGEDGAIDTQASSIYTQPLPRLDVKVENGKIYVRVPPS